MPKTHRITLLIKTNLFNNISCGQAALLLFPKLNTGNFCLRDQNCFTSIVYPNQVKEQEPTSRSQNF